MMVGQSVGPFLIESELGSGAMGTVYKAKFTKDNNRTIPVALKVVSLGLLGNEGAMARFEREAAILKQLKHPHVVRLLATGRYRQTPFIAMEFVDGESLEKTLARRGRLDWLEVVAYAKQLCDALQHAHEKGIVHRDLKPSNLMVTNDGVLKLTDFGIAKDTDVTALTGANSTIGTAAYMSPEQCRGDKTLGPKSDLYSLGVCLYELLTGVKPFTAESTVDLFLKHVNEVPPRPRRLAADMPVWLDNLIMFCLEKNKESRPIDAATVGRMLAEIEEKVRTNQSVGEEMANARKIDRPVGQMSDTDRELARQLRTNAPKKRKKKRDAEPRPPWRLFALAAVPVVLLLVYAGYSLTPDAKVPETAEEAFARLEGVTGEPEARRAALEQFIRTFPTHPKTDEARALIRRAVADRTESALLKRFSTKMRGNSEGYDPDAYALAITALEAEEKGQLKVAADLWTQSAAKSPKLAADAVLPGDDELRAVSFGWVAERRVRAVRTEVPAALKSLQAKIANDELYELLPPLNTTDPDSLAYYALRTEQLGDRVQARQTWERVVAIAKDDPARLVTTLLARQRAIDLASGAAPTKEERASALLKRIETQGAAVKDAEARAENSAGLARTLRNTCRVVAAVYSDDAEAEFQPVVETARRLLPAPSAP